MHPADFVRSPIPDAHAIITVNKPVSLYLKVTASNCAGYVACHKVGTGSGPGVQTATTQGQKHVYSRDRDGEWITVDLDLYARSVARDSPDALGQSTWVKGKFTSPFTTPEANGYGTTVATVTDSYSPDARDYVFHGNARSGAYAYYN